MTAAAAVKVYFGGLSEAITEDKFRQLLSSQEAGVAETAAVTIKPGYAFAMYDSEELAKDAIAKFNGYVHNSLTMIAEVAKDSDKKRSLGSIRIVSVPTSETQKTLEPLLSKYGKVESIEFVALQEGEDRSVTVTYQSKEEAEEAVKQLNEVEFGSSEMSARMLTDAERSELKDASSQKKTMSTTGNGNANGSGGNNKKGSPTNQPSRNPSGSGQKGGNQHSQGGQRSVDFPLRILVQSEMVGAIIGRSGHKIREITQQSRARVDIHRKENLGMIEKAITIYGQPSNCSDACLQILKVMQEEARETGKPDDFPLKILAHNNLVGRIIGKQGATIKRIMEETETKITVSSINEINAFNVERVITVRGSCVQDMSKAEAEISSKLRAAYEGDIQVMAPQLAMYPNVHPAMMGYGIAAAAGGYAMRQNGGNANGGGGGNANGGSQVGGNNIPYYSNLNGNHGSNGQHGMDPNGGLANAMGGMAVRGGGGGGGGNIPAAAAAAAAAAAMQAAMMQQQQQEVCNIFIPSSSVGAVIGTKGTYIRQVIRMTGATIKIAPNDVHETPAPAAPTVNGDSSADASAAAPGPAVTSAASLLPPSNFGYRKVTIIGTSESQIKAQFCIFEKVHEDQYTAGNEVRWNLEVMVPSVHVGRIIGRSGANVRELQRKTGTMIKLPEEGVTKGEETPVLIMGPIHSVVSCQQRLREMTREAINTYNTVPTNATSQQHHYPAAPMNGGGGSNGGAAHDVTGGVVTSEASPPMHQPVEAAN